jgi:outer membrane protein OmpA-like peptidoglycan-associated protein
MATNVHDDYLICREYQEQIGQKSSEYPGFITFKHDNGNHYFAWVDGEHIILRSEAYPDADKMERGIKAVIKNRDLAERYSTEESHGAHFLVLWGGGDHQKHTGNMESHNEIGRSCPQKSAADLTALLTGYNSGLASKIGSSAVAEVKKVVEKVAAPAAAAAATSSFGSTQTTAPRVDADVDTGGGLGWLKWLLPLLLAGVALYLYKGCNKEGEAMTEEVPAMDTTVVETPALAVDTVAVETGTRASANVKLIDGSELKAYAGGVEEKLVNFLNDKNAAFDPKSKTANWYDFDNLNFDLGKSTITAESDVQIANLTAILKAYPALKIKVGGYTDKKGDDASNMKLSQSRADAVVAALKAKGTNAAQLVGAEGYGETMATIAESESEEARRVDRRTAVRIMAK